MGLQFTKVEKAANIVSYGAGKTAARTVDGTEHVLTTTHADETVVEERWNLNQGESTRSPTM